jgi:glutaminyl-tRNA synthetase
MCYTVTSKSKIAELVEDGVVKYVLCCSAPFVHLMRLSCFSGWDDPRLCTLPALRRRGVPPEAINDFVAKVGLPAAQLGVDPVLLDEAIRDHLELTAPRFSFATNSALFKM